MAEDGRMAEALLEVALETYRDEIQPDLPSASRYAGAMTGNAIAIALRSLRQPDAAARLVERIAADEAGDLASLARAIRAGTVSDTTHGHLRNALMEYLEGELAITNPRFLERRSS